MGVFNAESKTFSRLHLGCWSFTLANPHPTPLLPPQVQLGGDTTAVLLEALTPETVYAVTVFALHGEAVSEPLEGKGTTRRSPPSCLSCSSQELMSLWFPCWPDREVLTALTYHLLSSSSSATAPCW